MNNPQSLCQKISRCCQDKINFQNQIVKLAIYLLVVIIVASITITGEVSYDQQYYFLQNKILNKNARGIFPPLSGNSFYIHGGWKFLIQIGQQETNLQIFKSYTLIFQNSGELKLVKQAENCTQFTNKQNYTWKTFSYNMKILKKDLDEKEQEQENVINPDQQENMKQTQAYDENDDFNSLCFVQNQEIFQYIQNFTVWTFAEDRLYMMSEIIKKSKIHTSIFVLSKYSQ